MSLLARTAWHEPAGHRVAVKGLYIEGVPARINLTSVVDLGAACPEGASKEQA